MAANIWEEWLRQVENVGYCVRYEAALSKRPRSAEQLFKELGTVPEAHRKILAELFQAGSAGSDSAGKVKSEKTAASPVPTRSSAQVGYAATAVPAALAEPSVTSAEKRIDPEDGLAYTLEELHRKYLEQSFSKAEVLEYWQHDCQRVWTRSPSAASSSPAGAAQRRYAPVPPGTFASTSARGRATSCKAAAAGVEKRTDPDDGLAYTLAELEAKYAEDPFSREEVLEYWEHDCMKIPSGIQSEPVAGPPTLTAAGAVSSTASMSSKPVDSSSTRSGSANSSPGLSKSVESFDAGFAAFLLQVDPSGDCSITYLQVIEDNYDSVEQIEELYVTGQGSRKHLDLQLFDDIGVADAEHRRLFTAFFEGEQKSSPSLESAPLLHAEEKRPRKMTLAEWLQAVDPSGGCSEMFLKDVEDNFDSLSQIEGLYIVKNGVEKQLDPQFFEDIGVEDAEQRRLFRVFFECAAVEPEAVFSQEAASAAEASASASGPTASLTNLTFAQWIEVMDPSGSCQGYLATIEENYDDLGQIVELYLRDAPAGQGKLLDGQFFEDIGVHEPKHRVLFKAWFDKEHGIADQPAAATAHPPALAALDQGRARERNEMTLARWLQEVDLGSGATATLLKDFEENYDDVAQIKDLYAVERDGKTSLDEQLFEDMSIEDDSVKVLFRRWFAAL